MRIKISACAVCLTGLHVVDGELADPKYPIVPGHEIVGHIDLLGEGVKKFLVGDRIGVPWLGWTCGVCEYCLGGEEDLCPKARFTGYQIPGGFAESAIADARYGFALPANYSDEAATPLMRATVIGWRCLKAAGDAKATPSPISASNNRNCAFIEAPLAWSFGDEFIGLGDARAAGSGYF